MTLRPVTGLLRIAAAVCLMLATGAVLGLVLSTVVLWEDQPHG